MTTPTHHPPIDWLLSHANRSAPDALSLLTASHVAICASCASESQTLAALGGTALAEEPPRAGGDFEALLAKLDQPQSPPTRRPRADPLMPAALVSVFGQSESLPWKRLMPGVHIVPAAVSGAATVRLMRFRPGFRPPLHTHQGLERTLVLSGGFSDDEGVFERGDLSMRGEGPHDQRMHDDAPCVCLFVNDGSLVPLTWFGRLLSRFVDA